MLLFVGAKFIFRKNIKSIFSYNRFLETRDNFWVFSIFINIIMSSLLGLIFYKTFKIPFLKESFTPLLACIIIAFLIGLFFIARFLVNAVVLYLTKNNSVFKQLIKSRTFLRTWVAIILLPICFIAYYSSVNNSYITYFVLFIMSFLFMAEYIYSFKSKLKPQNFSLYYFILYLCTLEILPLLFIVKWLREFEMTL